MRVLYTTYRKSSFHLASPYLSLAIDRLKHQSEFNREADKFEKNKGREKCQKNHYQFKCCVIKNKLLKDLYFCAKMYAKVNGAKVPEVVTHPVSDEK